jgi:methionyl aminopeptidase
MAKQKVEVRTNAELALMRKSGEITAIALKKVLDSITPGITMLDIERLAEEEIVKLGGKSSFKTVPGYDFTTCLTVNDEVVHGIPRDIVLKKGDIISVDLGAMYKGWHTDTAWSVIVGGESDDLIGREKRKFLAVGEEAMWAGIKQAVEGNHVGDISSAMQNVIEGAHYSVVKSLVGHGVGKSNHEAPEIPGVGKPGTGLLLQAGMTLAIEAIYVAGEDKMYEKDDGWTIAALDGSLGGLFEMTVIVGKNKAEVITDWRRAQ